MAYLERLNTISGISNQILVQLSHTLNGSACDCQTSLPKFEPLWCLSFLCKHPSTWLFDFPTFEWSSHQPSGAPGQSWALILCLTLFGWGIFNRVDDRNDNNTWKYLPEGCKYWKSDKQCWNKISISILPLWLCSTATIHFRWCLSEQHHSCYRRFQVNHKYLNSIWAETYQSK